MGDGLTTKVDDEDYEWLSKYRWYAYVDPGSGHTYAATDTPSGRRIYMHNVTMGLDSPEDELQN